MFSKTPSLTIAFLAVATSSMAACGGEVTDQPEQHDGTAPTIDPTAGMSATASAWKKVATTMPRVASAGAATPFASP
jgi:hypothetical protein